MSSDVETTHEVDELHRDWPAEATDTIVRVVDTVREATTANVQKVVKAVVYGTLAALLGLAVVIWFMIALFRVVNAYLPPATSSWSTWVLFGTVFTLIGIVLWVKRGRLIPRVD